MTRSPEKQRHLPSSGEHAVEGGFQPLGSGAGTWGHCRRHGGPPCPPDAAGCGWSCGEPGSLGKELAPSAALWGQIRGQSGQGPVWGRGARSVSHLLGGGPCFSRSGLHRWRRAGVSSQLWGFRSHPGPSGPHGSFPSSSRGGPPH